jgi:cytosine/creatinine deaminase
MDLLVRNAKLRGAASLRDILVDGGKFADILESGAAPRTAAASEIDAGGNLVIPPFVDPHVHLDAVFLDGRNTHNRSGTLLEGIRNWGIEKETLTAEDIYRNALRAVRWYVANGALRIRTHVDTTLESLANVAALTKLRDDLRDDVDIQIVAFPQDGMLTEGRFAPLMERALDMGCDVVGGIPHNEMTREDGVRDVELAFELADRRGLLVDIHCDETGDAQSRFVETMAKETVRRGMRGRATASHTTAMHNYDNDYAFKLVGLLARSGMHMVTNPFDNSVLQNRNDGYPRRRGHTRADELLARGVNVCIGHDSIMDPWYPMGKASMLSAANLFLHYGHFSGHDQIPALFDMITVNSARAMAIEGNYGIERGKGADFAVLDAADEYDAIRLASECLFVVRRGRILSRSVPASRTVTLGGSEETVTFKGEPRA